jgi:uncharacterized membrane protein YphA (DoxX/SURF4 family)
MPAMKRMQRVVSLRADARQLAAARIVVGVNAAFASFEAWRVLQRLLAPMIVRIPLFAAVPVPPPAALPALIGIWLVSALAFTLGWKTRLAGVALTLATAWALILDQQTYSNHLYLLVLMVFLLTLADSGAAWSLDARRKGARSDVEGWPVVLLQLQITIVYCFSALAKITPPYLAGEVLMRTLKREGWLAMPQSWRSPGVLSALAVSSIVLELFIAFGLWSRRLRFLAIGAGIGFHLLLLAVVDSSRLSLGIFALSMFAGYLLFIDAERWRRWMREPG